MKSKLTLTLVACVALGSGYGIARYIGSLNLYIVRVHGSRGAGCVTEFSIDGKGRWPSRGGFADGAHTMECDSTFEPFEGRDLALYCACDESQAASDH